MEEPGRLQSMGSLRVGHDWAALLSISLSCIGEGNGNPLQCSCLEKPRDRETWWAAVYGVAQSQTRLKRLSMHACIGEGNGNRLQYSCLENPRDRGVHWAAVYGVAQSWTWLKRLSSSSTLIMFIYFIFLNCYRKYILSLYFLYNYCLKTKS